MYRQGRSGGSEVEPEGLGDQPPEPPAERAVTPVDLGEAAEARLKAEVRVVDGERPARCPRTDRRRGLLRSPSHHALYPAIEDGIGEDDVGGPATERRTARRARPVEAVAVGVQARFVLRDDEPTAGLGANLVAVPGFSRRLAITVVDQGRGPLGRWPLLGLGALIGYATLVRSTGAVLLVVAVIALRRRRGTWRSAARPIAIAEETAE